MIWVIEQKEAEKANEIKKSFVVTIYKTIYIQILNVKYFSESKIRDVNSMKTFIQNFDFI